MKYYYYYNLIKKQFDPVEFIGRYEPMYFSNSGVCPFPRLNRTDPSVEKRIVEITEKDSWKPVDVFDILAWKTGTIKQKEYGEGAALEYTEGTCCSESEFIIAPGGRGEIKELERLFERVCKLKSEKCELTENKYDTFEKMEEKSPKNVGTVYLITLLFFLSKGALPIYDKFAHAAIKAVKEGLEPGTEVKLPSLPGKTQKDAVKNLYDGYITALLDEEPCKAFGYQAASIEKKRAIDRALWVYGHYFNVKQN